jgi:hypothetical protein
MLGSNQTYWLCLEEAKKLNDKLYKGNIEKAFFNLFGNF